MKFLKIKLLVFALVMFAASSAFASLSYNVSVDTFNLGLNGTDGYLYLQFIPVDAVNSTATVSNFATNGLLGVQSTNVVNGSAVTGTLPGAVVFANTNGINDYNHAIHFGNSFNFDLLFASIPGAPPIGTSTFSLGLFSDEGGLTPLATSTGTLLTIDLHNDGITAFQTLASQATVTPTPIPAAAWLLGSGLMGLVGVRRRKK